ncbi:hypothetical protein DRN98_05105 [Methanosarcinales archaeon]|nr:MAG: hypothetical protein DRN98_05105 [Methanosarcinales archaeon]
MAKIIRPKRWQREGNKQWVPQESFFFPQTEPPDWPGKSEPYYFRKMKARLKCMIIQKYFKLPQNLNSYNEAEWGLLWEKWGLYVCEWAKLTKVYPNLVNIVSSVRLERLSRKIPKPSPSIAKQTGKLQELNPSDVERLKESFEPLMKAIFKMRLRRKLREIRE